MGMSSCLKAARPCHGKFLHYQGLHLGYSILSCWEIETTLTARRSRSAFLAASSSGSMGGLAADVPFASVSVPCESITCSQ